MSLKTSDYDYDFPEELIALERVQRSRILKVDTAGPQEISWGEFYDLFRPHDLIVVNNTKVVRARLYTNSGFEILFISTNDNGITWDVLCPARKWPKGETLELPGDIQASLISTGLPQSITLNRPIDSLYFQTYGELPLPPYIQKARGERHMRANDQNDYQTIFAKNEREGSLAAPTASLHFTDKDRATLETRGVVWGELTLHVGLGTFLPVHSEQLNDHIMHKEYFEIPDLLVNQISEAQRKGGRIWALGTTVVRSLESWAIKNPDLNRPISGESEIFIYPGYKFKVVQGLLTNFHQPRTTLMALVSAFRSREELLAAYKYAIEKKFRLFSYGDLTVWPPLEIEI